jgi:hypothetical protein
MVLALDVATLARAWTSQVFALKPPSGDGGDGGYGGFNLKQVPFGASLMVLALGFWRRIRR